MHVRLILSLQTIIAKRRLEVIFAPHLPPLAMDYYITSSGVHASKLPTECCHQHTHTSALGAHCT